jgi:SAM-dependent methyltransferase
VASSFEAEGPNAQQAAYWNEQAGPKWVALQERLDRMIGPLGREALDLAAPAPGERALDVGCGCGDTTLLLAERVGPGGRVLGIDLSAPMLERARARGAGAANLRFEQGDAQTHGFGDERFDLIYSRFGVMFFADPPAAFANLRGALAEGGRLAFVCWQDPGRNDWARVTVGAVLKHVPPPPPPEPDAPGPFALADAERVRKILGQAGFAEVRIDASEGTLLLGGDATLDEAVEFGLRAGPASRLLAGQGPETLAAATESLREALAPFAAPEGVRMPCATWLVTAR